MTLLLGDCLDVLRTMPDCSVDAVVTDPPYGLKFMGKKWDYDVPTVEIWAECLRVLKPGGHLLAFAGTRTQHRMAVRIEDAGFEIRDMIAWVYGSGFPKSLDVSKAIDKAAGVERTEVIGYQKAMGTTRSEGSAGGYANGLTSINSYKVSTEGWDITAPATTEAQQWDGWGTALKPALEPITMARKPLDGTVAANVLAHGTGGVNIDGCRVRAGGEVVNTPQSNPKNRKPSSYAVLTDRERCQEMKSWSIERTNTLGRWPANLIHDGSDEVVGLFTSGGANGGKGGAGAIWGSGNTGGSGHGDGNTSSAARFFYCSKASKLEKGEGNTHPTVKPVELMRYLCRLVTPPGGIVLDPFMGSGSTGMACELEGFDFIGIEREPEYLEISTQRIRRAQTQQSSH